VLFQTCINSFLLNTKEDILKNVGNQTVDRPHRLPTMEVLSVRLPTFFKISLVKQKKETHKRLVQHTK